MNRLRGAHREPSEEEQHADILERLPSFYRSSHGNLTKSDPPINHLPFLQALDDLLQDKQYAPAKTEWRYENGNYNVHLQFHPNAIEKPEKLLSTLHVKRRLDSPPHIDFYGAHGDVFGMEPGTYIHLTLKVHDPPS